jgi:hypothetical protein
MHNINKVFFALLMTWLVYPAMCSAYEDDLLVVSYYPENGVYDINTLINLVKNTEKLWTIKDQSNQSVFSNIDSLATENIIMSQQDTVRFRRLIEKRELMPSGLLALKKLVNTHPLLHDRLADQTGKQLHIWLRTKPGIDDESKTLILSDVLKILNSGKHCHVSESGILSNITYQEWQLKSKGVTPISTIYENLEIATDIIKKQSLSAYSATDLIGDLKRSMGQGEEVNTLDSSEIEQLYMIAESVRSRHLHDLANPDFSRLKLVRLVKGDFTIRNIDVFDSELTRQWQANENNYQVLDCRN